MTDKKLFFIYNPRAGKGKIKNHLLEIIDVFVKKGYEVTTYPTQCQGDAIRAARERNVGYDLVVCSGGDGTLDEVVTGMIASGEILPLGYVPAGSTNDFANSLRLPKNMIKSAQIAVGCVEFPCDIGTFNDDVFVYIAAFGLFTEVSYGTGQGMKNMLGHMAYILESMKRIPSFRAYQMKFSYENTAIEGEFIYGMITNSMSVGGFKGITGNYVELNDGEFEVTLIRKPTNPLEINEIISALLNHDINTKLVHCFKTKKLCVRSLEPVAWTLDGEFGGEHKKILIKNYKQAIRIKVDEGFIDKKKRKK